MINSPKRQTEASLAKIAASCEQLNAAANQLDLQPSVSAKATAKQIREATASIAEATTRESLQSWWKENSKQAISVLREWS